MDFNQGQPENIYIYKALFQDMRNTLKSHPYESFADLTPWETEKEENYTNQLMKEIQPKKKLMNLPNIMKKRTLSQGCHVINENSRFETVQLVNSTHQNMHDPILRHFQTLTQHRKQRFQRIRNEKGRALQELSVKNFVIEGHPSETKRQLNKKKESTYILKQKFAQIRRSIKLVPTSKENVLCSYRYDI